MQSIRAVSFICTCVLERRADTCARQRLTQLVGGRVIDVASIWQDSPSSNCDGHRHAKNRSGQKQCQHEDQPLVLARSSSGKRTRRLPCSCDAGSVKGEVMKLLRTRVPPVLGFVTLLSQPCSHSACGPEKTVARPSFSITENLQVVPKH